MQGRKRILVAATLLCLTGCHDENAEESTAPAEARRASGVESFLPQPSIAHAGPRDEVTIADIAERISPSVVSVSSVRTARPGGSPHGDPLLRRFFEFGPAPPDERERLEQGLGSGVVVGDGLVLTNAHVVQNADRIRVVTSDSRELDAELAGADPQSDIAVLKLRGDTSGLRQATFGDSERLRPGDVVLAVGNPFGVGQTVTMGIVSAKGRADVGITDYEDFIQTDAAINPGNSGGALVSMDGKVVGINTAILSRTGGYMGIGFAVPSSMVQPIMKSLIENGRVIRGWMGVAVQPVDRDLAQAFGLEASTGALISDVDESSPARKAGIERGDIVLSVDGEPVTSAGQLRNAIASAGANKTVQLELLRDGKKRTLEVKLAEMPTKGRSADRSPRLGGDNDREILDGLLVENITENTRQRFKIPDDVRGGVLVIGLHPQGSAARAGLLPGDVILEVNRKTVTSVDEFKRRWTAASGKVLIRVTRQGRSLFLVAERG